MTGLVNIKVIGVGGGGNNAVDRIVRENLKGVEFVAANTDLQQLDKSLAENRLQIGAELTRGLGAGANPEIGKRAAEESRSKVQELLSGTDMLFIAAGMGGGTGTGGAPIIAEVAKEMGILTVGVVTKPFRFEGPVRMRAAEKGIQELSDKVDTLIVIPNEKLLQLGEKKLTLQNAFQMVDDILFQGIKGISDLITTPGFINLDFADLKTVMAGKGYAHMGLGVGQGEDRVVMAAKQAITSPLLETSIKGATHILINFTGNNSLGLMEVSEAMGLIEEYADPNALVMLGTAYDENMKDNVAITVVATGFQNGPGLQKPETTEAKPTNTKTQPQEDPMEKREAISQYKDLLPGLDMESPDFTVTDIPAALRFKKNK